MGDPLVGDLDGNGVADRATLVDGASPGTCAVAVELGLAGGGYGPPTSHDFTVPGSLPEDLCPDMGAIVDLGGDDVSELVLAWFSGAPAGFDADLLVLRDFAPAGGFAAMYEPSTIDTADLDADGLVDVYETTDQGDGFQSFLNTPTGQLVPGPLAHPYDLGSWELTDVDEDAKADLALSYAGYVDGEFSEGTVVVLDDGTRVTVAEGLTGELTVGDANKDGHIDIAVQAGDGLHVFLGNGAGGFAPK